MAATGSNQTLAIVGLIHGNCMQQGLSMFLCPAHIVFGGIPFVQEHFEIIVLGIVAVSVAPAFIGAVKAAMSSKKGDKAKNAKHAK